MFLFSVKVIFKSLTLPLNQKKQPLNNFNYLLNTF